MYFKPLTTDAEWEWIRSRARPLRCEDSQGIVAYDDHGITACFVADSFNTDSCNVHLAIDKPLVIKYGFFHEIARHIFTACDRKRMFALVPANNEKALRLDKHIGFREVARVPDGYCTGVDYIVLRMDRESCVWHLPVREAA